MARKGVLVSSPDVKKMTHTEWMLEFHALKAKEESHIKLFTKIAKTLLVSTLGLNLIRPQDDQGHPKPYDDMTQEEKEYFIPLSAWCGREEMVKLAMDQMQNDIDPSTINNDKEYEKLAAAIDDAGGDMEPILGVAYPKDMEKVELDKQKQNLGIKDKEELLLDVEGKI